MGESIMNSKIIQDRLNQHGLVFRITDERLKQATYEKTNDVVGVLEVVSGGYLYDETGSRVLTMQVEFVGKNKDFNLFREIVNEHFPNKELVGDVWVYAQPLQFSEFPESEGVKKFNARIVFQVVEVVGGVSGRSTSIQVDGVEIDFTNVLYRQDKTLMPFKAFGVNKEVKLVNEIISIKLPMSDNTKNISLITEALDNSYNASHEIKWNIGGLIKTFDAVLRVGIVEYSKNHEPLLFTITFERALPREEWGVALFHKEHFWEIDHTPKPYSDVINEDFETESELRDYLTEHFDVGAGSRTIRAGKGENFRQNWEILLGTPSKEWDLYAYDDSEQYGRGSFNLEDFLYLLELYPMRYVGFVYRIEESDPYVYEIKILGNDNDNYEPGGSTTPVGTIDGNGTETRVLELLSELYPDPYEIDGMCSIIDTFDGNLWYFVGSQYTRYWYARVKSIESDFWFATAKEGNQYSSSLNAPVVDYAAKHSLQTTQRWKDNKIVGKPLYYANGFTVMFLLNETTRQFIDDLHEQKKNKYKITYTIGSKTYTYEDMLVSDIDRQNTENANQVMQVTFTEGE